MVVAEVFGTHKVFQLSRVRLLSSLSSFSPMGEKVDKGTLVRLLEVSFQMAIRSVIITSFKYKGPRLEN